ncbi:MAG TPA: lysophospholipid acyltransferase family protein [Gemmatimonadaceae bacterium]|nr:lysophospholipid acyltransferase family protein [Gemmatimonadaceae bacterium]
MTAAAVDTRRARRRAILSWLGGGLLRVLARTWRIRYVNRGALDVLRAARQPVILCLWHGEMLPHLWAHRDQGITVLISEHGDGEIIARIATSLGCKTVRGSSSRGADRALLGMCRVVDGGGDAAFTPDGPRGPAHTFAPGVLIVSQRTGAPVVPLGAGASRAWRLSSWDRFLIPKPFARVTIAYGTPTIADAASAREAVSQTPRFEALMAETNAVATRV